MLSLNNDVSKVILRRLNDWCQTCKCGTYAACESGYMYCMCVFVFCTSSVYDTLGSSQASYQRLHITASHKEMTKSNYVTENTSQIEHTYASKINAICVIKPDYRNSSPKVENYNHLPLSCSKLWTK